MKQVHYKTLLTNVELAFASLSKQGFSCRTNFTSSLMDAHALIDNELDDCANVVFYTSDAMETLKASNMIEPSISLGISSNQVGEVVRVFKHFDLNCHGLKDGDKAFKVDMTKYDINAPIRARMAIC